MVHKKRASNFEGRKHTEEAKKKMSIAKKGKKLSKDIYIYAVDQNINNGEKQSLKEIITLVKNVVKINVT